MRGGLMILAPPGRRCCHILPSSYVSPHMCSRGGCELASSIVSGRAPLHGGGGQATHRSSSSSRGVSASPVRCGWDGDDDGDCPPLDYLSADEIAQSLALQAAALAKSGSLVPVHARPVHRQAREL